MLIAPVYQAYSNRDDDALVDALTSLQVQLIRAVQVHGPAKVALQLSKHNKLTEILNKVAAETSTAPAGRLAFAAGFISAYCDYLKQIVDRHDLEAADAQLSADSDANDSGDDIRMMILKSAFAYAGARAKELVSGIARAADVSESAVKFHLKKLVKLKLLERIELGPKAVSYRVSRLGEAVLARRSKPHELALFLVDLAAHDKELRAAMKDEMGRTWRKDPPDDSPYAILGLVGLAGQDKMRRAAMIEEMGRTRLKEPSERDAKHGPLLRPRGEQEMGALCLPTAQGLISSHLSYQESQQCRT
jgi:DNA-binding Lrp family transcriptional regulator